MSIALKSHGDEIPFTSLAEALTSAPPSLFLRIIKIMLDFWSHSVYIIYVSWLREDKNDI